MLERSEQKVYIPYGIKNRREHFKGFGNEEARYVFLAGIAGGAMAFFVKQMFGQTMISALLFIMFPILVGVITIRDDCNMSVVKYAAIMMRFSKKRKFYIYKGYKGSGWNG